MRPLVVSDVGKGGGVVVDDGLMFSCSKFEVDDPSGEGWFVPLM